MPFGNGMPEETEEACCDLPHPMKPFIFHYNSYCGWQAQSPDRCNMKIFLAFMLTVSCLILCSGCDRGPQVKGKSLEYWQTQMRSESLEHRRAGIMGLAAGGAEAKEAVPDLINLLEDKEPSVVSSAAWALGKVGKDAVSAVPELIKLLGSKDAETRRAAAAALGAIARDGGEVPDATASLLPMLQEQQPASRKTAAVALGSLAKTNAEISTALPKLVELLRDKEPVVRAAAAGALGRMGPAAKEAVYPLSWLSQDPDPKVRQAALDATRQIENKTP